MRLGTDGQDFDWQPWHDWAFPTFRLRKSEAEYSVGPQVLKRIACLVDDDRFAGQIMAEVPCLWFKPNCPISSPPSTPERRQGMIRWVR